ncbi:hypothetical protein [Kitasatospora sp. NPDC004531]
MTGSPRTFAYVGPPELLARAGRSTLGRAIPSRAELYAWLGELEPAERDEPVTYVVDRTGVLRLARRRSEHVACAGGADVLAAGEIRFELQDDGWAVREISNLSTGYCPDLDSWAAAATALDRAGIPRPGRFTTPFVFRRCPACTQLNLVKDEDLTCAVCDTPLPAEWNLDNAPATSPGSRPTSPPGPARPARPIRPEVGGGAAAAQQGAELRGVGVQQPDCAINAARQEGHQDQGGDGRDDGDQ